MAFTDREHYQEYSFEKYMQNRQMELHELNYDIAMTLSQAVRKFQVAE